MVPGWLYAVMGFFLKTGYAEWRGPGVLGWLVARERYIDDTLQASLQAGLEQLVILGAGYDSRPYRFEALKSSAATIRVFEVDHPATQVDKQDRLVKIFGQVPAHVVFVPVDFNTQSLPTRLSEMGYNPSLKTLFIWQGVSMYLQARAVDETLSFVETCSGTGSAIVFDYIYQSALDGLQKHGEVSNMRRYRFMTGEGLTFGIPRGTPRPTWLSAASRKRKTWAQPTCAASTSPGPMPAAASQVDTGLPPHTSETVLRLAL